MINTHVVSVAKYVHLDHPGARISSSPDPLCWSKTKEEDEKEETQTHGIYEWRDYFCFSFRVKQMLEAFKHLQASSRKYYVLMIVNTI